MIIYYILLKTCLCISLHGREIMFISCWTYLVSVAESSTFIQFILLLFCPSICQPDATDRAGLIIHHVSLSAARTYTNPRRSTGRPQRVCSQQRLPQTPVQQLALYRWAQQALDTDLDCPLLPALWQHFFSLYLARVYDVNGWVCRGGGGRGELVSLDRGVVGFWSSEYGHRILASVCQILLMPGRKV